MTTEPTIDRQLEALLVPMARLREVVDVVALVAADQVLLTADGLANGPEIATRLATIVHGTHVMLGELLAGLSTRDVPLALMAPATDDPTSTLH